MENLLSTVVVGVSVRRSAVFAALAVALFVAGGPIDIEPGAPILPLLVVVAVLTAVQSTNGSPALGLALAVAPVAGVWPPGYPPDRLLSGAAVSVLRIGLLACLLLGLVGHLAGAQFATLDPDRYSQQSTRERLALVAVVLLVVVLVIAPRLV
ncbi:hypothetical protein BRC89_05590 [Halobacteriales archaeon QS_4_70_19]|nr:MAG: hypothetical protein BRC89_05590 [Halobacteriales archaeon QS_4_70_19]